MSVNPSVLRAATPLDLAPVMIGRLSTADKGGPSWAGQWVLRVSLRRRCSGLPISERDAPSTAG